MILFTAFPALSRSRSLSFCGKLKKRTTFIHNNRPTLHIDNCWMTKAYVRLSCSAASPKFWRGANIDFKGVATVVYWDTETAFQSIKRQNVVDIWGASSPWLRLCSYTVQQQLAWRWLGTQEFVRAARTIADKHAHWHAKRLESPLDLFYRKISFITINKSSNAQQYQSSQTARRYSFKWILQWPRADKTCCLLQIPRPQKINK